jgi:phosphate transport system protein
MVFSFPNRRRADDLEDAEAALPGLAGPAPVIPEIDATLVQIFALVGEAIAGATHALLSSDREAAKTLVAQDEYIDELTYNLSQVVEEALIGPGRHADERQELIVILKMLPDLERNGDLAEHIARRAARGLGQEMSARSRGLVERMGEVATTIWRHTADVVADRSPGGATAIEDLDDELDDLHVTLTAEIVSGSMAMPVAIELALVGRFYERFGDHAVNLARRMAIMAGGTGAPPISGTD